MKFLLLATAMISATAFAAPIRDVELTKACEAKLIQFAVEEETNHLADLGETLASNLEGVVYLSYWPAKDDVNVSVHVEDKADGRYVRYRATVLKTDALTCNIVLKRADDSACRYSSGDGIDGLLEIQGMKFENAYDITPDTKLTQLQAKQIRAFLGKDASEFTIKELIEATDDSSLSRGTLTLPNGRYLSYYGAYGGDNPYGIFFEEGTTKVAGDNSDGSICIK